MQQFKVPDRFNYPKQYSRELYQKTKKYQKQYGFEVGKGKYDTWNNESDAFKHTFGAAEIAIKTNITTSKVITDYHESHQNSNPAAEENMDKWNNLEGRKIAQEIKKEYSPNEIKDLIKSGKMDDIIAEKVIQKMKKGELITNPETDERKYTENSFMNEILNLKNRVFHKGELSMDDLKNGDMRDAFLEQIYDNKELPAKEELDKKISSGELVHVDNYTRSDGTKVSGYYRAYPKG